MPRYSKWTEIAFDVAQQKGVRIGGQPPNEASAVIQVAAEVWSEDKERYRQMTVEQAREVLNDEITVS